MAGTTHFGLDELCECIKTSRCSLPLPTPPCIDRWTGKYLPAQKHSLVSKPETSSATSCSYQSLKTNRPGKAQRRVSLREWQSSICVADFSGVALRWNSENSQGVFVLLISNFCDGVRVAEISWVANLKNNFLPFFLYEQFTLIVDIWKNIKSCNAENYP